MLLVGKSLGAARSEDKHGTLGRTVKKVALAFLNMFLASFVFPSSSPALVRMRSELSRSHIKNQRSPPLAQNETLGDWYALWLVFITILAAFVGRFVPEDTIPKSLRRPPLSCWLECCSFLVSSSPFSTVLFRSPFRVSCCSSRCRTGKARS